MNIPLGARQTEPETHQSQFPATTGGADQNWKFFDDSSHTAIAETAATAAQKRSYLHIEGGVRKDGVHDLPQPFTQAHGLLIQGLIPRLYATAKPPQDIT